MFKGMSSPSHSVVYQNPIVIIFAGCLPTLIYDGQKDEQSQLLPVCRFCIDTILEYVQRLATSALHSCNSSTLTLRHFAI